MSEQPKRTPAQLRKSEAAARAKPMTKRQTRVLELCDSVRGYGGKRGMLPDFADKILGDERDFLARAMRKGFEAHRHGWPDFLLEGKDGSFIGVEVKSRGYEVNPVQARTFAALERLGVRVYVWDAREPEKLQPWQNYMVKLVTPKPRERRATLTVMRFGGRPAIRDTVSFASLLPAMPPILGVTRR